MKSALIFLAFAFLAACSDKTPSQPAAVSPREGSNTEPKPNPITKPLIKKEKKSAVKPGQITGVEIGQLFILQQSGKVHLIDVRPPLYFRLGHIDGAVNFPLIKYDKRLAEQLPNIEQAIKAGKTVVLYCQNVNCPDAYKTGQKLIKLGHSVSIYKGGWEEWKKSGL
ncbi:MAG: rhodanese-like domain-containing protein [Akkermansiaceae bacterium]